jgi:hypothetical protein
VTGLSLHKPSALWPPPSNDISCKVRSGLRKSIGDVLRRSTGAGQAPQTSRPVDSENVVPKSLPTTSGPINVGSTASLPLPGAPDASQSIVLRTADGEVIEVAEQVQLYAPNSLLKHPLVSPALSYLGGLPPLFFIAGDKEVLRDEIIYACVLFSPCFQLLDGPYSAHRAAHPERFPLRDETKDMYPTFNNVGTHMRPTPVHLQVYDGIHRILSCCVAFLTTALI